MKCPKCQAELTGEEKFCIKCGTKLQGVNPPVTEKTKAAETPAASSEASSEQAKPAEAPAPKTEQPKTDEKIASQAEQPKTDEKIASRAEQPKTDEKTASQAEQPKADEKTASQAEQPKTDEKTASQAEQPKADEKTASQAVQPKADEKTASQAEQPKPDEKTASQAEQPKADEESAPAPSFCIKCGSKLKPGVKFCTKCGAPVDGHAGNQPSAQAPAQNQAAQVGNAPQSPQAYSAPSVQAYVAAPEKKSHSEGLILVIILVIIALIVAILLALKSMGILSRNSSDQNQQSQTSSGRNNDEDEPKDNEEPEEPEEPEEDPEAVAARLEEIENIKSEIADAVKAGDGSEGVSDDYPIALDGYITLGNDYDIEDEVSDEALSVFDKYTEQVRYSVSLLDGQRVGIGLYEQSMVYYDSLLEYAVGMKDAGYDIDVDAITEEHDSIREIYRTKFIEAINEISTRENWSRDEAWTLMEEAASLTGEEGNRVLFNEDDPDDPLRLRYIYSLARVTRKHLETGLADGSLTAEDCLDRIDEMHPETDYNLQLLYDAIFYCGKAGIDPAPYEEAYNAILAKLVENEGIFIITDPAKATDTNIDIEHFWAFNDIDPDADASISVSATNGTTAATRAWIRENIRVNR